MAKKKTKKSETIKPVIIDGKKLTGEIVKLVNESARGKKQSVNKFVRENKEAIKKIAEANFIDFDVRIDELITYIQTINKRTFFIDDGNGVTKHSKKEVIQKIMDYVNYVKSNSNIDFIMPHAVIKYNGTITVDIPDGYDDYEGEELENFLEENDVESFSYSDEEE